MPIFPHMQYEPPKWAFWPILLLQWCAIVEFVGWSSQHRMEGGQRDELPDALRSVSDRTPQAAPRRPSARDGGAAARGAAAGEPRRIRFAIHSPHPEATLLHSRPEFAR